LEYLKLGLLRRIISENLQVNGDRMESSRT
jgi:hypothetical protein